MAAAANSLNLQGQELVQAVSLFRWDGAPATQAVAVPHGRSARSASLALV